ncbi:hypothetical protein [Mesorhizobium carmichaelinearum]|uniref:hypothetical protein n=1 Tax=Mesorhizobium carmichaelinearum TaxID=1208188 RepID=UPI001180D4CD|nr:hypothetical protein [Mesorhizobium carmichaelinearum]
MSKAAGYIFHPEELSLPTRCFRAVGRKAKQRREEPIDRERVAEADFYARRCGLTREEALKLLKETSPSKPVIHLVGKGKGR